MDNSSYNPYNYWVSVNQCNLLNEMNIAWMEHILWTRMFLISVAESLADLEPTKARLLENPKDIADIFRRYYGANVANIIEKLLTEHLVIGGDLIVALKNGNPQLAQELKARVEADEQIRQKIGDIFVEAKHSAASIIENATENAHTIVRSANECANNTIEDITFTRTTLDNVRTDLSKMLSDFDSALNSISLSLDKAKAAIKPSGFRVNTDITEDDLIGNSIIKNS